MYLMRIAASITQPKQPTRELKFWNFRFWILKTKILKHLRVYLWFLSKCSLDRSLPCESFFIDKHYIQICVLFCFMRMRKQIVQNTVVLTISQPVGAFSNISFLFFNTPNQSKQVNLHLIAQPFSFNPLFPGS